MLAFRKGKYFFVARLKVISIKKCYDKIFWMVIESPSSLNNAVISFLIQSSLGPFALFIVASPSCLYKLALLLLIMVLNLFNK